MISWKGPSSKLKKVPKQDSTLVLEISVLYYQVYMVETDIEADCEEYIYKCNKYLILSFYYYNEYINRKGYNKCNGPY